MAARSCGTRFTWRANNPRVVRSERCHLRFLRTWQAELLPFTHPEAAGPDALKLVEDGTADMLTFGALFLAGPDLPARLALGGLFNARESSTFYGGDHRGCTDYPALTA
ncbi:hypothetical protein [Kitasatospora sp. McL0602]|uniref:hypothetical protein n=1 Tax=Kitasatospora sp. McL0602 TaxID=3439530 RepID=UPI003F8BAE44